MSKYQNSTGKEVEKRPNELQLESLISLKEARTLKQEKLLIVLPSGAGKTYVPAFDLQNNYPKERLLFVTHRNELVDQTVEYFKDILGEKEDIGVFNAVTKEKDARIVIATIQTLSRMDNLYKFKSDDFKYLVIDEFHHAAAKTYQRVINYFTPEFLLALTATPFRLDGRDILELCDNNIGQEVNLAEGIERGFLVPFIYYGLWDDIDYSNIEWNGYKYTEKDLDKALLIDKRDDAVIRQFKDKCGSRKAIGFCCSIKHVRRSVAKFTDAGISCAGIVHRVEREERKRIIDDFKKGKIQIIFTRDIFNEGVDFPEVEAILLLRPTESRVVFLQQIGRGLRLSKGKENVMVLDFIGNYHNAFKIRELLEGKAAGKGIEREKKPEYKYPLGCEVHFDKEVVDLIDRQEELFYTGYRVTDQDLIDEYFGVKKELGRQPTSTEFDELSKYSVGTIIKHFKTWNEFLKSVGESVLLNTNIQNQDFIDEYFRVKKELGRQPTSTEFDELSKYSTTAIRMRFKTWNAFLKSIGEPVLFTRTTNIQNQDLIDEYFRVKKELGDQPTSIEFGKLSKYSVAPISRRFKTWNEFLKSIGESVLFNTNIQNQDLIDEYFRVKKELGHQPTSIEFGKLSKHSTASIIRRFKTWNEFLKSTGEPVLLDMNIQDQDLIDEYFRVKKELGRQPTYRELDKLSKYSVPTIRMRFKTWNAFLKSIGEKR